MPLLILARQQDRDRATAWIRNAPWNTRVEFKEPKRTLPQNDRLHAMLDELRRQVQWHGLWLSVDDWKLIFLDALQRELRIVPNLDGTGFVNLGRKTSKLSKQEFSDLFAVIEAFAARHGVVFGDERKVA